MNPNTSAESESKIVRSTYKLTLKRGENFIQIHFTEE